MEEDGKKETGKWKVGKQPDDCFNGEGGNDAWSVLNLPKLAT